MAAPTSGTPTAATALHHYAGLNFLVGEDLDRMALHLPTFQGSTTLTPVCWKSFTLRVAHTAP